jgi:tetratricopeptide (TPR) repeat protein
VLGQIGVMRAAQQRLTEAAIALEEAVRVARAAGELLQEARILFSLSNVLPGLDRWAEAFACHERTLAICAKLGDEHNRATAIANLGHLHHRHGSHDAALSHWRQAVALLETLGEDERAREIRGWIGAADGADEAAGAS